jgi:hypothetical protein
MMNPESFGAGLGHAASVSHVAQRIDEMEIGTGWTWRTVAENVAVDERAPSERFGRLLQLAGDQLIVIGTWLKSRSGQASYQHA